jgi:cytidine deaminase
MTESGQIFSGCNIENASYGLAICAERVAIFNAISHRQTAMRAVCVVGGSAKPCGACRQVMLEFSTKETPLYLVDLNPKTRRQKVTRTTVFKMLPSPFDPLASGLLPAHPQNLLRARASMSRPQPHRRASHRKGRKK